MGSFIFINEPFSTELLWNVPEGQAEYQNRTGDERLETFSFASKLIPHNGRCAFALPSSRLLGRWDYKET